MKVIYDEAKAKKKAKRENRWFVGRIAALVAAVAFYVLWLVLDNAYLGATGSVILIFSHLPSLFSPISRIPLRSAKNSDIAYMQLSKEYKILEVKVEEIIFETKKEKIPYLTVNFIAENKEGEVENIYTGILEERESTKVEEDAVDLNKGVLYKPYIPKEENTII